MKHFQIAKERERPLNFSPFHCYPFSSQHYIIASISGSINSSAVEWIKVEKVEEGKKGIVAKGAA